MTTQPRIIIREDTGLFRLATRPPMPHDIPHDEFTEAYVDVPQQDGAVVRYLHVSRVCRVCKAARVNTMRAPRGGPCSEGEIMWRWAGETCLRHEAPVCVGVTG